MTAVRWRPNFQVLFHLCFPLFVVFGFFRCFAYPTANSDIYSSLSTSSPPMTSDGTAKKLRKPYTITKTRDRWTNEEHERFLDVLLFHAQKYFLKVQRIGLGAHVPPPIPKRKTTHSDLQNATKSDIVPLKESVACPSTSSGLPPVCSAWDAALSVLNYASNEATSASDCHATVCDVEDDVGHKGKANVCAASSNWPGNSSGSWIYHDASSQMNPHPSHPVPNFTQIYGFLGNLFDPDIICGVNVYLEKLEEMDSVSNKTVLILMKNLTANLCNPDFEHIRRWLSAYRPGTKAIVSIHGTATSFEKGDI